MGVQGECERGVEKVKLGEEFRESILLKQYKLKTNNNVAFVLCSETKS